jgi:16S rRNA processing protein RimM
VPSQRGDVSPKQEPPPILVGEIVRPHGLRGEVVVNLLSENPDRFAPGSLLRLGPSPDRARLVRIVGSRPHGERILLELEGIGDRGEADRLRGHLLFVSEDELLPLEGNAYWEHQLAGMEVVDVEGRVLGSVAAVVSREEQDLWEIRTPSGPVLLPAAKDIVLSVDLNRRTIVVDPPEGLFH